jgi:hypothetical protein
MEWLIKHGTTHIDIIDSGVAPSEMDTYYKALRLGYIKVSQYDNKDIYLTQSGVDYLKENR